jgi:hypothetical protein
MQLLLLALLLLLLLTTDIMVCRHVEQPCRMPWT